MSSVYLCPECETAFDDLECDMTIQNMNYNPYDDAIQAVSLVNCPKCQSIVMATFDTMECWEEQKDF